MFPVCYHGEYHYRTGAVKMVLKGSALTQFLLEKSGQDWDAAPTFSGFRKDEHAFTALAARYKKERKTKLTDVDFESFGLALLDGRLTNTGALLADDCPLRHSRVFCTRWNGLNMAAGVMDAKDNQEFAGGLLSMLQYAEDFVRVNSRHSWHKLPRTRAEFVGYPDRSVHEAIVNMLMHRDYRHGQYTQIIRYDNRIEICNSGCSLKPDDMLGMKGSVTRNDTIARVCHDTKLAETKGSGIDRMWRKMVEAGLSRPTMESDRTAATFTIRLLLCHFFDEDTLDWLRRFAAYDLNDNQRTALVFLREVGAIDAVAYRQLTGCKPKLVAKELAGIKDQGLMIQKGRTRGTYYVPAGSLEESIEDEKHKLISQAIAETTTPRAVITTPSGETTTPSAVTGTPSSVTGTPQGVIGTPPNENSTKLSEDLLKELEGLKRRASPQKIKDLILSLCRVRPMTREELMLHLKRGSTTIDNYIALMIGKELDYLYPMMPHHPRQAYVALDRHQKEDVS